MVERRNLLKECLLHNFILENINPITCNVPLNLCYTQGILLCLGTNAAIHVSSKQSIKAFSLTLNCNVHLIPDNFTYQSARANA